MDNAMVKRGIGAVVLAIIAALLLGYLLKDKSRDREQAIEMKLPGAPEITIPSLSDATNKVADSATTLVNETKETISNASDAVVASATGTMTTLTDSASNAVETVTQTAENVVKNTEATSSGNTNPGFSFRPPTTNEEQQINSSGSAALIESSEDTNKSIDNVVASSAQTTAKPVAEAVVKKEAEKKFKPTIEKEPKKVETKKPVAKKTESKAKPAVASAGGKYTIQLLATSSQSRAKKLAKTMNSEGYVSFITQTKSNNKVLYRVRVGGHKDRNAALSAQETMKRRYQKNFFVQNSLVVSQ